MEITKFKTIQKLYLIKFDHCIIIYTQTFYLYVKVVFCSTLLLSSICLSIFQYFFSLTFFLLFVYKLGVILHFINKSLWLKYLYNAENILLYKCDFSTACCVLTRGGMLGPS